MRLREALFNHVPNGVDLNPVSPRSNKPLDFSQEILWQLSVLYRMRLFLFVIAGIVVSLLVC